MRITVRIDRADTEYGHRLTADSFPTGLVLVRPRCQAIPVWARD